MAQPTLLRTASKAHDFTSPGALAVDLTGAHAILVQAFQDSTADGTFGFTGCSIVGQPGLVFSAGTEVTWNGSASKRRAFWLTSGSIPSGSQTINVTWTGSRRGGFVVYVFNDAGGSPAITIVESTPVATTGSSPAAQSFTVTSTTAAAECLAFVTACNFQAFSGTLPATGSGGTTAVGYDNASLVWQAWFSENGAATSTVLDWTWSTTGNNLSLFGFSLTGSIAADTTPPTLTSPTGTKTGTTTASGTVSTDEANGTLYRLASTNATESAATVKAAALTTTVTATGSQSVTFTGLTASTTYYAHYVHRDAAGNDSARVSSASFTTDPASDTTAPTLTGTIGISALTSTSYTATCPVATDNVAVTGYQYRINAGSWVTIAGGGRAANITGRTASTTDTLEMRAFDAATNYSSALSASVNLPALATYSVSAGPCYFNTGSGPQLSVAVSWSLIYANVGGYNGATTVDGTGTLHATTGLLAISGLDASGPADLYVKDAAGGIYYQRVTAA